MHAFRDVVTATAPDLSSKPRKPLGLHSIPHRQAVDLFRATKGKIVASARASIESVRLLGSNGLDFAPTPPDAESLEPVTPQRAFVKHNQRNIQS